MALTLRTGDITAAVAELRVADHRLRIGGSPASHSFTNEWCFFFKPSITSAAASVGFQNAVDLALDLFDRHDMAIIEAHALSPGYMRRHRLASWHYRELVEVAMRASTMVGATLEIRPDICVDRVLGGYEALTELGLDGQELDRLWYASEHSRLGRSAIGALVEVRRERILLVNGFIPGQVRSYSATGTVTVVLRVASDECWSIARNHLLGAANPADAVPGSFRHELWSKREQIGLPAVDVQRNGAHLSAGPLEALYELQLLTSVDHPRLRPLSDFSFGRRLLASSVLRRELDSLVPRHAPAEKVESVSRRYVRARETVENQDEPEALTRLESLMHTGAPV
jgi:hypothetical protein